MPDASVVSGVVGGPFPLAVTREALVAIRAVAVSASGLDVELVAKWRIGGAEIAAEQFERSPRDAVRPTTLLLQFEVGTQLWSNIRDRDWPGQPLGPHEGQHRANELVARYWLPSDCVERLRCDCEWPSAHVPRSRVIIGRRRIASALGRAVQWS